MKDKIKQLNLKLTRLINNQCNKHGCNGCNHANYDECGDQLSCEATELNNKIYELEHKNNLNK